MNYNIEVRAKNLVIFLGLVMLLSQVSVSAGQHSGHIKNELRHRAVLDMYPAGYWPADEGQGARLGDYSGNGNHGQIYNIDWIGGLLDFTGVYQWIEIPATEHYTGDALSIGGWVYSRRSYDKTGIHFVGNAYRHSGFTLKTLNEDKSVLPWGTPLAGISLILPRDSVSVVCGGKRHAVSAPAAAAAIGIDEWQHLLFTYADGIGKLYINGILAQRQNVLSYQNGSAPFIVGIQAELAWLNQWWNFSLDGSIRDLVLFSRALNEEEIRHLVQLAPPRLAAPVATAKVVDAEEKDRTAIPTRSVSQLVEDLQRTTNRDEQVAAVRSLGMIGERAKAAVPTLLLILEKMIEQDGIYPLRSNDLYRNAVIWALETIDPEDPQARAALGLVLAKPIFDSFSIESPFFEQLRSLIDQGRYMDALDLYRIQPLQERAKVSRVGAIPYAGMVNMKGDRIYTPIAHYNGDTYVVGIAYVPEEELARHPMVEEWTKAESAWVARAVVTRIDPSGRQSSIVLEGEDFIFNATDIKMHGWSLGVDQHGYLHLMGGMHNWVNPEEYIPGSFEHLGLSRRFSDDNYPVLMYWVSSKVGDIASFEFVGQRHNPRRIPVLQGLNYMPFERDRNGVLYTFGRIYVQGQQAFGLYRYDASAKRWTALGGYAPDVKKDFPVWANHNIITGDVGVIRSMRSPHTAPENKAVFWERGTSWYNFSRGMLRFDRSNRMHFTVPLNSIGFDGIMKSRTLYAYSEDGGETFHRADGTKIESLPMTCSAGPGQADVLDLGGATRVYFDAHGIPAVYGGQPHYWHIGFGRWVKLVAPLGGLANVFTDNNGIITYRSEGGERMWRSAGHGLEGQFHEINQLPFDKGKRNYTNNVDWREFYDTGRWRSVQTRYRDRVYHPQIHDIEFVLESFEDL